MKRLVPLCLACLLLLTACGSNAVPVTLGTVSDTTYESAFLELGFVLPEGFRFSTKEEIAEQYGVTYDEQSLDTTRVIYDMAAYDEQGDAVSVSIERIALMNDPVSSAKEYLQNLADAMGLQLEQMNFTDVSAELTTLTFADKDTDALVIRADFSGTTFHQTYLCERRGDVLATVSILSLDETLYGTLLNSFYRPTTTLE